MIEIDFPYSADKMHLSKQERQDPDYCLPVLISASPVGAENFTASRSFLPLPHLNPFS